ncbi:snapalysin family zinc-dependent metalloprotease [Phycicoccus sonneratiae]|uniref:Extracellular small neutral protease n=1 Tax=Phycicoccus sonneratiae TaxID=2807628 RepID=A0ABS2CGX1_9MICO|nr:snapalysin family zinc-dependent metalloprotease [Phycicoccus sonneraticus]MBM6399121.1 snapalysin family zinc-dependent metalloprotease [Phycicoccus sonneraticus]
MKHRTTVLGALAATAALAVGPLAVADAAPAPAPSTSGTSGYTPNSGEAAQNARLQAIVDKALEKRENAERKGITSRAAAYTVYYSVSGAPSFQTEISQSAQIWNSSVSNVDLVRTTGGGADLTYGEGNDPRGSYAQVYGPGSGSVFLDYAQNQQYDSLRVTAHETGHILGLPDNYSGPCSELMSGGGPGPSCTNPYPNAQESATVDSIFGGGFAAPTLDAAAFSAR